MSYDPVTVPSFQGRSPLDNYRPVVESNAVPNRRHRAANIEPHNDNLPGTVIVRLDAKTEARIAPWHDFRKRLATLKQRYPEAKFLRRVPGVTNKPVPPKKRARKKPTQE